MDPLPTGRVHRDAHGCASAGRGAVVSDEGLPVLDLPSQLQNLLRHEGKRGKNITTTTTQQRERV